jgi:hypothetical protein
MTAPVRDDHWCPRPSRPRKVLEAVPAYRPLAGADGDMAWARRDAPTVFIDPAGQPIAGDEAQALQAKFTDAGRRQRHVGDLVVLFCHQHLKGGSHGRTRNAEFPKERSQRIKADCLADEEGAHPILVAAEAHQVHWRFPRALPTFNVDDTRRPVAAVTIDIGSTRDPPRPVEESIAVREQAA